MSLSDYDKSCSEYWLFIVTTIHLYQFWVLVQWVRDIYSMNMLCWSSNIHIQYLYTLSKLCHYMNFAWRFSRSNTWVFPMTGIMRPAHDSIVRHFKVSRPAERILHWPWSRLCVCRINWLTCLIVRKVYDVYKCQRCVGSQS